MIRLVPRCNLWSVDTCAIKNNCVYTYAGRSQYFLRVVEDRLTIERTIEHVYGLKLKCREREIMYRKQKKKKGRRKYQKWSL